MAPEDTPFTQRLLKIAAVLALPILVTGTLLWNQQHTTGFDLGLGSTPIETPCSRIEGEDIRFPELDLGDPLPFIEAGAPDLPNPAASEAHMPVPRSRVHRQRLRAPCHRRDVRRCAACRHARPPV